MTAQGLFPAERERIEWRRQAPDDVLVALTVKHKGRERDICAANAALLTEADMVAGRARVTALNLRYGIAVTPSTTINACRDSSAVQAPSTSAQQSK